MTVKADIFNISVHWGSDDCRLFHDIIDYGIDARLTAFTKSRFRYGDSNNRLFMGFHPSELEILIRRLLDVCTDEADRWADDIVLCAYDYETI